MVEATLQDQAKLHMAVLQEAYKWLMLDDPDCPKATVRTGMPTQEELAGIREQSRWFAKYQPFYISALSNRQNYTVGSGHRYTVRAKEDQEVDADTLAKAKAEIDEFREREGWQFRQQEMQCRFDRDGEVFLRMFVGSDGRLRVRFIEPEHIATPPGQLGNTRIRSGVEHADGDVETPVTYYYQVDPQRPDRFDTIDASEIQHRKAGVDCTWPRGLPLCEAAAINDNLRRSLKLLRNITTAAGIQTAIAIVRKHAASSTKSVQEYAAAAATRQVSDGETMRDYQRFPSGAVVDLPNGVEYDFPAGGIDVTKFAAGVQAELRAISAALAMPEFMLTADASNANYASTMVAEGPAVKMFERLQAQTIWYDAAILRRVVAVAEDAGRLPAGISQMVAIEAEAPITQARDRLAEAQADQILLVNGVASPQSVAGRHGYDWAQERQLMDQAEEETGTGIVDGDPDDPEATPDATPTPDIDTSGETDIQKLGLNGAQIDSLLAIVDQVGAGTMEKDTAQAVMAVAFPFIGAEQLRTLIATLRARKVTSPTTEIGHGEETQ
jgi:hypothetical protein